MPNDAADAIRQHIAAEVRAEMARQGMTIRELAAALGKDHTTTWKLTRGGQAFRAEDLALTARVLSVPVSKFLPDGVAA